jgi:RNA polymerase-binding transcription factor DksA
MTLAESSKEDELCEECGNYIPYHRLDCKRWEKENK